MSLVGPYLAQGMLHSFCLLSLLVSSPPAFDSSDSERSVEAEEVFLLLGLENEG